MKFSINQSELQNALGTVLKGTSSKSTLPILSGIYIETQEDALIFQATNLDLSIQYQAKALVEEPGKTVVPGKLFFDIVKNLRKLLLFGRKHLYLRLSTAIFALFSQRQFCRFLKPLVYKA